MQQPVIDATDGIPVLGTLFGGAPYGIGIFTAGLILSIMILPFISAVTRDVFETVPSDAEGSDLWPGLHHLGSDVESGAALLPAPAWWAAPCWRWAAPWAKPWRSPS